MKQLKLVHRLQVRNWSTNQMIMSLSGQTLSARRVHRPGRALKLWFPCQTTLTGVFSLERDPRWLPFTKQRQGPFCPSWDPRPIISTDYRWPVWQPYWLRERLFHGVPLSSLFSMETEIFSHFVSVVWKRTGKKRKPKKKSPTHLFPFTVFPLASPIQIWLQRCSNWKAFVCRRSYCSLINCKLGDTRCLSHQLEKRDLNPLFKSCFAHFALVTSRLAAICWNLLCYKKTKKHDPCTRFTGLQFSYWDNFKVRFNSNRSLLKLYWRAIYK